MENLSRVHLFKIFGGILILAGILSTKFRFWKQSGSEMQFESNFADGYLLLILLCISVFVYAHFKFKKV